MQHRLNIEFYLLNHSDLAEIARETPVIAKFLFADENEAKEFTEAIKERIRARIFPPRGDE